MNRAALCIAIVGAESTGKSTLARELAQHLGRHTGLRCTAVGEWLRDWCEQQGRTPRRDEQQAIASTQTERIAAAAADHDIVIADTTALMTAVYSDIVFGDRSLDALALADHGRCQVTLLTALDIAWVPDGLQRDGPQVRGPVDERIRAMLAQGGLDWHRVQGQGPARLASALQALQPVLAASA